MASPLKVIGHRCTIKPELRPKKKQKREGKEPASADICKPRHWQPLRETAKLLTGELDQQLSRQGSRRARQARPASCYQHCRSYGCGLLQKDSIVKSNKKKVNSRYLPNPRLYRPTPPRYTRLSPARSPIQKPQPIKLRRQTWGRYNSQIGNNSASQIISNLTEQIKKSPQVKTYRRTALQKCSSPQRIVKYLPNGKRSLVVKVPAVSVLKEAVSSERRKSPRIYNQSTSPERPLASGDFDDYDKSIATKTFLSRGSSPTLDTEVPIVKTYMNGAWDRDPITVLTSVASLKIEAQSGEQPSRMASKELCAGAVANHSSSPEHFSDGTDSHSAPNEFLAEFLSAIMRRQYGRALKYCRLILRYEPLNTTARDFHPLLVEKLACEKEEGSSDADPISGDNPASDDPSVTNNNTDAADDDDGEAGSSYNSDDSYLLDDELEEGEAGSAGSAGSGGSTPRTESDPEPEYGKGAGGTSNKYGKPASSGSDEEDSRWCEDRDNGNTPAAAASGETHSWSNVVGTSNDNYRKQHQEEARRLKIEKMRAQFVHSVN